MTAYAAFENDMVGVTEAKSIARSYNATRDSILSFVTISTTGINEIPNKPNIKLMVVIKSGMRLRTVFITPSDITKGVFSDTTSSTIALKSSGEVVEYNYTLDNYNIYPIKIIQGHLYFEIPLVAGESRLTSTIVIQQ